MTDVKATSAAGGPEGGTTYTAFAGSKRVVRGTLEEMLRKTKKKLDANPDLSILVFDDRSGREVDFDFRGTIDDVLERAKVIAPPPPAPPGANAEQPRGPGRPKLGVVAREITLLPRHWEWLEQQEHGISATLRRLVDEARKKNPDGERARTARAAASRFMWVMGGDLPNFEEASRALFASDKIGFEELIRFWPADVRHHLDELLREGGAFPPAGARSDKPGTKKRSDE